MSTVQISLNGLGGVVQGNYGTYQAGTDGTCIVDARDVPAMLALGATYVNVVSANYATPIPPTAATVGAIVASGALSNGTVSVTSQPNELRPVTVEVGTGTVAISAGTATVVYTGNDGVVTTDSFSLACAASTSVTQTTSKGVDTISSITVAGVSGGLSPWFRMSTTAAISLPVAPGAVDVAVQREYDGGATIAVGTLTSSLASITPTTAPNGTLEYSFMYSYTAPGK
jgi:hypothetical protein